MIPPLLESVDTSVIVVTIFTSVTLSNTGFGLIVILISIAVVCGLSLNK